MTTAIATDTPVTSIRFGRTGDRHVGGVDQACRADLAGLQQPQLLHVIEQGLVKLRVDLHIAHQAHHVLFHVRQLLDLAGDAVELRGQACDLAVQDFDRGVIRGEAHDQFLALLAQFLQLALDLHRLRQDQLRFLAEVDRAALVAHRVVTRLGGFHLLLELRQLAFEEVHRLLGFRGLAAQVLVHVLGGDLVQDGGGGDGRCVLQRHADHAALLAALADHQLVLQVGDGGGARHAAHAELGAGVCVQLADVDRDGAAVRGHRQRLADRAFGGFLAAGELEPVLAVAQRGHYHAAVFHLLGHVEPVDHDRLAAPGEPAKAEQPGLRQFLVVAGNRCADKREIAWLGVDVETQRFLPCPPPRVSAAVPSQPWLLVSRRAPAKCWRSACSRYWSGWIPPPGP
jgi:hypothetical protein